METVILDSHALLTLAWDEKGADKVQALLEKAEDGKLRCMMTAVNWGEVYYMVARKKGPEAAELMIEKISHLDIGIIPVDQGLALQAAIFKSKNRLSYADAMAAALAKLYDGSVVTGDKEFKALEKDIKLIWL